MYTIRYDCIYRQVLLHFECNVNHYVAAIFFLCGNLTHANTYMEKIEYVQFRLFDLIL